MNNEIIKDYGKTVDAELYIRTLQEHPYIPQADQAIRNAVDFHLGGHIGEKKPFRILDAGCGPGRLTFSFCGSNRNVEGWDVSESFVDYANKQGGTAVFYERDIIAKAHLTSEKGRFDCIVMQGVMHHVHGKERQVILRSCRWLLADDGILIVGDEFIRPYETEKERLVHAALFYLHIIGEAEKGGFHDLAKEEAKNLIDDCLSATVYAGLETKEVLNMICRDALVINRGFYQYGADPLVSFAPAFITGMIERIKEGLQYVVDSGAAGYNRGDFKISIPAFKKEMHECYFSFNSQNFFGPVQELGGMAVLTFKKKF